MQRVGFERLARRRLGDATQHAGAEEIDHDRGGDDDEGRGSRFDGVAVCIDQPLHRFPNDDGGEHEQQRRLGERGHALHLAVAILVLGVGRLAGNAHREIGQHGRRQIDQRMAGFGQGSRASR